MATKACQICGEKQNIVPIYGYDWDNPNDDEAGSIQVVIGYRCADKQACETRRRELSRILRSIPDDTYSRGTGQGWGHQQ